MSKKRSTENGNADAQSRKKKQKGGYGVVRERRYRFKNFNERIEDIDISSIQNIGGYRGPGPQSTDSTWFELSLNEWKELNCSAAFAKFCYAVTPMTGTLAKLLFNKDKIVSEIFSVLKKANDEGPESAARLALVPVLSLTAMLAKDLGSEFQCHFAEFYRLLLPILPSAADPEIIEAAFATLLYVFKCVLNDLLNDLPGTFEVVAKPLLEFSDSNGHLRKFGAECFGYLLRKSLKIGESGFFESVEDSCDEKNILLKEFTADTFVAAILDDSTGRFRTCLKPLYLEIFGYIEKKKNPRVWSDILRFLSVKLFDETDQSTNAPLWRIFIQFLERCSYPQVLTSILIDIFAYRRGTRVQYHSSLLPGLLKFESIELCAHFLRSMNLESTLQNRQMTLKYIEKVLNGEISNLMILSKWLVKINWLHYDLILAEIVRSYISKYAEESELVLDLLQVLLPKYSGASSSLASIPKIFEILTAFVADSLDKENTKKAAKILIENFPTKFPDSLRLHFLKTFQGFIMKSSGNTPAREELIICTEVVENYNFGKIDIAFDSKDLINFIKEDLLKYPEQLKTVKVALKFIDMEPIKLELTEILLKCLRSNSSEWRSESIELLELLYARDPITLEIVSILKSVESVPNDLENYREKLLQLKKLEHLKKTAANESKDSIESLFILNYLIGFLQIKLTLLWSEGNRILSKFATSYSKEFQRILFEIFNKEYYKEFKEPKPEIETVTPFKSSSYDFDIDDDGLINLERIRTEIARNVDHKDKDTACVPISVSSSLLPAILKLFASHPETCLEEFRDEIFIPLIIETFKEEKSGSFAGVFIENNLNFVLQTLAGVKLEKVLRIYELEFVLLRFLAHGDLQIQNRALDAIFNTRKYGAALSSQWKGRLKNLLNDNLFREELTNLTSESESLPRVVHWHGLIAPLIVRILFGRFIARKGASAGRHSLPLRRKMIMNCFGTWDEGSLALIVDFLLESSKGEGNSTRQKLGFLNVLSDVFGSLGRKLDEISINRLIQSLIDIYKGCNCDEIEDLDDDEQELVDNQESKGHNYSGDLKRIRQLVMKRFLQLFKIYESKVIKRLSPFLPDLFDNILNPRIVQLSSHFTQSSNSSALLEILVCISQNLSEEDLIKVLIELSPQIWSKAVEAFANELTKPLVVSQLLTIFEGIILRKSKMETPSVLLQSIVIPGIEPLLDAFDLRLKRDSSQANSQNILRIVAMAQVLSPHVTSPEQASRLCKTFEGLLKIKTIYESIRTHLINSMSDLLRKSQNRQRSAIPTKSLFEIASVQWNVLKSRQGREALCKLFECFAQLNTDNLELIYLSSIFRDLNSWLPGKLGEPNFDLRLAAFAKLRKSIDSNEIGNSSHQELDIFIPITWAMVYFLQDVDELSIRNQSFGVMKSLINKLQERESIVTATMDDDDIVMAYTDDNENTNFDGSAVNDGDDKDSVLMNQIPVSNHPAPWLIQRIILPSIKIGLKSRQEAIRIEFVALLDLLISTFPQRTPFSSLYALINPVDSEDGDVDLDEENIFRNIYHIQEPRRNRAIRQIGEMALNGRLIGLTRGIIEDLLLPLVISTTLPDPSGEIEFTVSEAMQKDSISTCGALMAQLPWKAFVRKLTQFVKEISENKRSEQWNKAVLRLLPAMISQFKLQDTIESDEEFYKKINEDVLPAMFRLLHKSESANEADLAKQAKKAKTSSGAPLGVDKISVKHSLRVPIAISIGQLIKIVSRGSLDAPVVLSHLPKLLTDLLNVLKQKDADTRDVARGALVKIMGTFGAAFLPFLLREARTLLNRGYQRHVLTFTAHAILVEFLRRQKQDEVVQEDWNLDASADLLVDMALASSFGFQAAERATIEWSGKQPEVRAAKGPEIIALTAQFTSQPVLEKSLIAKITKIALLEIDEGSTGLLNTRGTGALDEKAETISKIEGEAFENLLRALFLNGIYPLLIRDPERLSALLALMHEILTLPCDSGSKSHLHRLQARAFEFLSHVLNNFKNNDESDQLFMGRIGPFVGLTREYILERGKHVVSLSAAISLFNQFISFKSLHSSISDLQPLLQKLFTIILKGNSGNSEGSAQMAAAYKLTSTLIRDWSDLEVTDTQIKTLIEYTRLQLENTHQQSLTFSLIRSLISRQIVLLQLFELMETVRTVMLTSHQPATRQQCRSAFIHFLTNYPMATKKLEEQLDFLLANVRYEFATGRESCIEVMSGLIGKLPVEVIETVAEAWFVGLAVQLARENSVDGSVEVSQTILRTISLLFDRIPQGKRRDNLELLLIRWIVQSPKLSVQGAAWKLFLPILKDVSKDSRNVLLTKAVELIADESTPEDLLRIVLKAADESIKEDLCPRDILEDIAKEASKQRFFKEDCDFQTRHSIAILWNSILN
jgi:U3 small nucleolar RNA-associated protein 20